MLSGLSSLRGKVNKLDVDKLKPAPVDLKIKWCSRQCCCWKCCHKLNAIDTSKLVNKTDYDAKNKDVEGKVTSTTNLGTTTAVTALRVR